MGAADSSEMVEAEQCWGRREEDPYLAEELRRQEVLEVVDNIEEKEEVGHKIYHCIHLEAMLYVP